MAVNRITNKQVVNKESVNRVDQISTKNTTVMYKHYYWSK